MSSVANTMFFTSTLDELKLLKIDDFPLLVYPTNENINVELSNLDLRCIDLVSLTFSNCFFNCLIFVLIILLSNSIWLSPGPPTLLNPPLSF